MRLLKITRHSSGWRLLVYAMRMCFEPLTVPAFLLMLMAIFSSCVIFWIEKHLQADGGDGAFDSIPHALWFCIVTISTVGYGDVYPLSVMGKAFTSILILCGVCYMAMPLAIVGGQFINTWENREYILIREKLTRKFKMGGVSYDMIKGLFEEVDTDGSGKINHTEFENLIESSNVGISTQQVSKVFRTIDDNRSGTICFDEFAEFLFPDVNINQDQEEDDLVGAHAFEQANNLEVMVAALSSSVANIAQEQQDTRQAIAKLASRLHPSEPGQACPPSAGRGVGAVGSTLTESAGREQPRHGRDQQHRASTDSLEMLLEDASSAFGDPGRP